MIKYLIPITAIVSLTVLEAIALYKNIDGFLLVFVASVISGIGGYNIRKLRG